LTLKAVLFDAGNTLLFLDYDRMAEAVAAALGLPLSGDRLRRGAAAAAAAMETARAGDRERADLYLETLFREAGVPGARVPEVRECLARLHAERHLWSAIAADTRTGLDRLRQAGLKLGVVSNSDGRVDEALEAAGLRSCFDVVVDSAVAGVEKPDPAIFMAALDALGVRPDEAVYVGDLYHVDVVGARAAGIPAILLAPGDVAAADCPVVPSMAALVDHLL
jgi:putative hydrolase of the HAD superfamily